MRRSRRNSRGTLRVAASLVAATVACSPVLAEGDPPADLAGDYFAGASVFLFQRTVLAAFAPAEGLKPAALEAMLDSGAVVLAGSTAEGEGGSVALEAMRGWLNAWLVARPAPETPPGFTPERRRDLACLVYGAEPDGHADLAQHAKLSSDERSHCVSRYRKAAKTWSEWLDPYRKTPGAPAPISAGPEGAPPEGEPVLRLAFAPTIDERDQAIADAMEKNGLFQLLTEGFNASFAMPQPTTALLTQCGAPRAFYNSDRGEAVLCYELLAALLESTP